jgi:hypothetical protein
MRKETLVLATNWGVSTTHGSSSDTGPDRFITLSVKQINYDRKIGDNDFIVRHEFDGLVFAMRDDEPFTWEALDRIKSECDAFCLMTGLLMVYTGPGTVKMIEVAGPGTDIATCDNGPDKGIWERSAGSFFSRKVVR